jgi:uncharacterized protein YqfA (UPF0365 family)
MNLDDFLLRNWIWLTVLIIATPLTSIIGWKLLRAWHLSLGAWMKGVPLDVTDLLFMNLRGIDTVQLVNQLIVAKQSGIAVDPQLLVAHYLAGGNMRLVIAGATCESSAIDAACDRLTNAPAVSLAKCSQPPRRLATCPRTVWPPIRWTVTVRPSTS